MPRCPSVRLSVYGAITLQTQPADCFIIVPRFNIQAGDSLLLQPISATPLPLSLHCFTAHLLLAGCWLLVTRHCVLRSVLLLFCSGTSSQPVRQSSSHLVVATLLHIMTAVCQFMRRVHSLLLHFQVPMRRHRILETLFCNLKNKLFFFFVFCNLIASLSSSPSACARSLVRSFRFFLVAVIISAVFR